MDLQEFRDDIRIRVVEDEWTGRKQVEKHYTLDEIKEIFDGDPNSIVMGLVREIEMLEKRLKEAEK